MRTHFWSREYRHTREFPPPYTLLKYDKYSLNLRDSLGNIGSIGATDTSPFGSTLLRGNRAPGGRTGLGTLRVCLYSAVVVGEQLTSGTFVQFGFSSPSSEPASAIELKMAPGISRDTTSDVSKGEHHGEEDSAKFVAV